ncbi:NAD(P)H-dependent glycerol-3-phosphate dehydrogenase [Egicoccus halophilus]|uniref:Glycerol-3-phosphate dehydrogenase [NAD(P)+] n=1 Tax=Egicoccus halophilus TaxID=1670830 RepID=A0A8J3A8B9_9ACTN|nr:NAD(P)H-dependent glycerol-3-phosphate dehydrogenase [Egicoccus halophilus]GGI06416.1 glycerol-3-phosphate dehydrogenase [NAD(P)+] [Egicoccus halophilus]
MGAGSWGTAFGVMCVDAGEPTTLWARREEIATEICEQHTNGAYLPETRLPDALEATVDPERALDGADVVVLAVPSVGIEAQLAAWGPAIPRDATLVSLIKGVDVETLRFGSQLVSESLDCDPARVVVVSGPNLASECAQRLPAATVAAGSVEARTERVQRAVMAPYFRVYTNPDQTGVEVGGAVKNVIALAAGMAHGLGFGDNTMAAVITRGLAEMVRLGAALGGQALTFSGLAGVGDLVATCTSPKSRNRTVGDRLGRGERLDEVVASMNMVAEGVKSSRAILGLAERAGVEMPITQGVVAVCHAGHHPSELVDGLLQRSAKPELYGL